MSEKILLVDDDANILRGYQRQLRKRYKIDTAISGAEALEKLNDAGPFAVIVSDMRMPGMDGVQLLARVRQLAPETVRMMLTGNADQQTAIDAVNEGHIFRFLNKPCPPEVFAKALDAALEQHRLITAERELLTKTLAGSVSLLTEILSMVNPTAFGRATSVRRLARRLCQQLEVPNAWEVEVAAMLSHIGCVTVSEAALKRINQGQPVDQQQRLAYLQHPQVGCDLVARIPRLRGVAEIIALQQKHYDGSGVPPDARRGDQIPLGARILHVALAFDTLRAGGHTEEEALAIMRDRKGWYDPKVLQALIAVLGASHVVKSVRLAQLNDSMVLDEHVVTETGEILVARDQPITPLLRQRLQNYVRNAKAIREPIRVRLPLYAADDQPERAGAAAQMGLSPG